jgi:alpha-1,3-rhamnosyl/mannosyltransferase
MRIGIDARYVYDHFPGIGRYVYALAAALGEVEHGHRLLLLVNPALRSSRLDLRELRRFPSIELVETGARPFSLGEQAQVPLLARRLGLDLLHCPYYVRPYGPLPCPSVTTIYDLIGRRFPRLLPWRGRLLFGLTTRLAIRRSRRLIAISASARDDIARYYGVPRNRIAVTPLAADRSFQPQSPEAVAALRERLGLPERYVLFLGSNKPHKNGERLVRAWHRVAEEGGQAVAGATLVMAGHYDPRYPEARRAAAELGLEGRVRFVPNVPEADLPALYAGAEIFCFPSYYEGFGLPPLEAMACGTPVVCGDASSLPEVVGEAALTVDPHSAIDITGALVRLLRDAGLRGQLRERGLRRARQFSWRRTALATLAVYEDAVQ